MKLIYLDMDGVLADLDTAFEKWSGYHPDMIQSRSTFFDKFLPDYVYHKGFYTQGVMPKAHELVDLVLDLREDFDVNVAILTSAGHFCDPNTEVVLQKKMWIESNFPELRKVPMCITTSGKDKSFFANKNSYLIDDHPQNIFHFHQNGGEGFIYKPEQFDDLQKCLEDFVQRDSGNPNSVVTLK